MLPRRPWSSSEPTARIEARYTNAEIERLGAASASAAIQVSINHTAIHFVDAPAFFYTVYIMQIWSPASNVLWVVRHRYSTLAKVRQRLLKVVNVVSRKQRRDRATIAALLAPLQPFPKKHIFMDTPNVVDDRKRGLADFVRAMFRVRELCVLLTLANSTPIPLAQIAKNVFDTIEEMLEIPRLQKEQDWKWRQRILSIASVPHGSNALDAMDDEARHDGCSICLEDLHGGDTCVSSVQLACAHAFHQTCVAEWLVRQSTCPLCRAPM
ncbi:hypothetical protein SDRG_07856 [Saprolegnia diclina VS20]|uniref:RING-type domain-containing protein n=1 Tax=Saprolegnia diclina (strain VS20) TaxID=1156394 RepID=T0RPW6_SAPDV|nr:hypothetical protein SDRG_07856 [Saprolegnia diclina VS20]EQC34528.1 hypothetical protein SDRG_07856 [Saprolegnia diclina VS20]|eukprot:XP_008611934.1 hypothetical protein SDRG_07856 [Saprolegnia diclina VS20]